MKQLTAKEIMTEDILSVSQDMSAVELSDFLVSNEISGAPVKDEDGRLVGVVSMADLARVLNEDGSVSAGPRPDFFVRGRVEDDDFIRGWEEAYNPEDLERLKVRGGRGACVADIMTPVVYTVQEEATVPEIARAMLAGHYHRLLVTRNEELVGIISSMDLIELIADE